MTVIREGSYNFHGVTHATMNHGEAWQFIRLGRYMERAGALPVLLDAVFCATTGADDLDWVGLLSSCSAFEAYCKVYTADLKPERVAEFLLLNPEFPVHRSATPPTRCRRRSRQLPAPSSTRKGAQNREDHRPAALVACLRSNR